MARGPTYRLGPDVPSPATLRDSKGRVVDDRYVAEAVEDAVRKVSRRGRPSLSEAGESPLLRVRISRELDAAVTQAAEKEGTSRSAWVRHVLSEASRRAS
jgi:predicted HicB family RNase H-like nuclease